MPLRMLRADLAGKFLLVGLVIERIIEISIYTGVPNC